MNKGYYAIIPANVRYDKGLPANAKLLYGEITALCNEKGYCWASNGYFADLYGVSKVTVSRWIKALSNKGYIPTEVELKENSNEVLHRYIKIVDTPINKNVDTYQQKCKGGINKNVKPLPTKMLRGLNKNVKGNNTVNNTVNNTIDNKKERKKGENQTDYDQIITNLIFNEEVKNELYEFVKMRKFIKKPLTNKGLELIIDELFNLSTVPDEQIKILDKSIANNWAGLFPLKTTNQQERQNEVKRDGSDYAEFDY